MGCLVLTLRPHILPSKTMFANDILVLYSFVSLQLVKKGETNMEAVALTKDDLLQAALIL